MSEQTPTRRRPTQAPQTGRPKAARSPTQPISSSRQPPFIGRGSERAAVRDVLNRAVTGPLGVTLIEGEPGVGKSRLMFESLTAARELGFEIAYGRCEALESTRPLAPIAEAFACHATSPDPVRVEIASLLAGPVGTSEGQDHESVRFRLVETSVDLIESVAVNAPLVVAIDDLHWADPTTLLVLRAAARRLTHLPIAIMATMRRVPRSRELSHVLEAFARDGAVSIALRPLESTEVVELVEACLGAPPGADLLTQVAGAAGNPLFVTELLKALDEERAIVWSHGRADASRVSLPPTLRLTILRRISFLEDETLTVLRAASVLGSSFALAEVGALLGKAVPEVVAALQPAMEAGIIEGRQDRVFFRHDLIRESLSDDLPEPVRAAMHVEAAKQLEALGAPPDRIAQHLLHGAATGDQNATDLVIRTAAAVHAYAPALSVALADRALAALPENDPHHDRIVVDSLIPMIWIGRTREAESKARAMLARNHDPTLDPALFAALWFSLDRQGRWVEARDDCAARIGTLRLMPEERRHFEVNISGLELFTGNAAAASSSAERLAAESVEAGDTRNAIHAFCILSWARCALGSVTEAVGAADDAVRLWERSRHNERRIEHANFFRTLVFVEADRFNEADADLNLGIRHYRSRDPGGMTDYQWMSAGKRFFAGEWDDAIAEAEAGFRLIEEGTGTPSASLFGHAFLGQIALRRGDIDAAEAYVASGEADVAATGPKVGIDLLWWTRALLLEARGNLESAHRTQAFAWDATASIRYLMSWRLVAPELVRLALAASDTQRARDVTAEAEEGARRAGGIPSADGAAMRCRGLLEGNAETMMRAVEAYRRSPRRLERALACEQAARLVGESGDLAAARKLFSEALDLYEGFGAARDADRTAAEMRRLGLRRGARIPRRRPNSGWASLTPTELRVIDLTVEGLTNAQVADRLFISKHTVRSHLLHVFTKLGIASRVELANLAARQRPPG